MNEPNNHINYSAADIEKYWQGALTSAAMHAMEKAALDDPFLAEAMDGYKAKSIKISLPVSQSGIPEDITTLHQRLADRVTKQKTIPLKKFQWWKMAAAFVLLSAGIALYSLLNHNFEKTTIARTKESNQIPEKPAIKTDSNLLPNAPADSTKDLAITKRKEPKDYAKKNQPIFDEAAAKDTIAGANTAGLTASPADKQVAPERNEERKNDLAKEPELKEIVIAKTSRKASPQRSANKEVLSGKIKGVEMDQKTKFNYELREGTEAARRNTFNGRITDQMNQPLANAAIQIPGLKIATRTDKNGYFSFNSKKDTSLNIAIAASGFTSQNLKLNNAATVNANQITLAPSASPKTENFIPDNITGKNNNAPGGKNLTIKIMNAEPVIDWNLYNEYLQKNKQVPDDLNDIHGDITVNFTVDARGQLRNFYINKSLDETLDQEAIRLIKEGPSWKLLKGKKALVSVVVRF